ncbi:hypothetical protein GALL_269470 [mine drainage metagenome]|uniref:Uncharacterized protein n=1 Tax=mine drainage metagenome TaxID=410659 RepID=A0A1J5R5D0_9ZZZZ
MSILDSLAFTDDERKTIDVMIFFRMTRLNETREQAETFIHMYFSVKQIRQLKNSPI